jgi:site-specific recombinase XerD
MPTEPRPAHDRPGTSWPAANAALHPQSQAPAALAHAAQTPIAMALDVFLDDLRYMRGASRHTLSDYRADLRLLCRYLEADVHAGETAVLADLTLPNLRGFVLWCAKMGRAPKSIAHYLTTLRTFCRFLTEQGALAYNPALSVQGPKVPQRKAEPATDEELSRFMAAIPDTPSGRRYRVFFRLLLETGLRIGEAVAVGVKHVDLDARMLYVRQGKGSKDRIVPLTEGMAEDLRRYLERLRPRPATPEDAPCLWLTRTSHRMSKSTVRVALEAVCKRAGLDPRRLHPHAWRAAFASRLARAGVPLTTIQELMGHASPVTTAHYVGVAPQAMRDAVERAALGPATGRERP